MHSGVYLADTDTVSIIKQLSSPLIFSLVVFSAQRVGGEVNVKIEPAFYGDYKFAKCFQDHKINLKFAKNHRKH